MSFRVRFAGTWPLVTVCAVAACTPGPTSTTQTRAHAPSAVKDTSEASERAAASESGASAADTRASSSSANDSTSGDTSSAVATVERSVLILGDSLAATAFGALLERELDAHASVRCARKAKSSTGLARPDFFDWMAEGKQQVEAQKPDLVVVILGGNDGQDLFGKTAKAAKVGWNTPQWADTYTTRMKNFLATLGSDGARKVMVLGLPQTETTKFEEKLRVIRKAQQDAVQQVSAYATYLDTTPLLSDDKGELRRQVKIGKHSDNLHAEDGIHFTMTGSRFFALAVYPQVITALGLAPAVAANP